MSDRSFYPFLENIRNQSTVHLKRLSFQATQAISEQLTMAIDRGLLIAIIYMKTFIT